MKSIYNYTKTLLAKSLLATLGICFSISLNSLYAQNPAWSLAPKYRDIGGTHSLPTSGNYNGNPAIGASNMQLDAQGNILFFVIDQNVYDKDGELIGSISGTISEPYSPYYCIWGFEGSELAIIPDPTSCTKYYIISYASSQEYCSGHLIGRDLVYSTLDFSEQRPNSNKKGKLSGVKFLKASNYNWKYGDFSGVLLATSNVRNSGMGDYRYLFVSNTFFGGPKGIVRFKIDGNGINFDGAIPYPQMNVLQIGLRAEMELIDMPNGHFKIAVPFLTNSSHNNQPVFSCVYIAELDATGQVYNNQEKLLYFYKSTNSQDNPYIHGLEFSPDGSKLFISHVISQYHPNSLEYYDFTNPNPSDPNGNGIYALNIGTADNTAFQFSHIEYAIDKKMYFGAEGRLASLNNPNNPSSNTLVDNSITIQGYTANSGSTQTSITSETKLYTLPD